MPAIDAIIRSVSGIPAPFRRVREYRPLARPVGPHQLRYDSKTLRRDIHRFETQFLKRVHRRIMHDRPRRRKYNYGLVAEIQRHIVTVFGYSWHDSSHVAGPSAVRTMESYAAGSPL